MLGIAQLAFRVLFFLFFFFFLLSRSIFFFFVGEKYGDACDVSDSTARSMSIACARVRVCAYACIHERNVDRRTIGCINRVRLAFNDQISL